MKVLVVEDNAPTRITVEELLRKRGHDVVGCADAESALSTYAAGECPLILLDVMLPGMDGLELCRRIRTLPQGEHTFILVVTARSHREDLEVVMEAGADDYIPKPYDAAALAIRLTVAERQCAHLMRRKLTEAKLARAMADLERSRDDLISILNGLQVGTAMADANDRLAFVSRTAEAIIGETGLLGRHWSGALPLLDADRAALADMCARPQHERRRISAALERRGGERRWVDIEVHDDPRDPRGRIFVFYDVSDLHNLRLMLDEKATFEDLVGKSAPMLRVYERIRQLAEVDVTVLIEGETGTGKELVARAMHFGSHRKDGAFIAVNCAGLTDSILASQLFGHKRGSFTGAIEDHKGFFEAADGGTIFLDEVGDVSPPVQTSLLRVLEEKEIIRLGETRTRKVDVRILAATNRNLRDEAARGQFRSDLLYRIRVAQISLPPLRERREDIPLLAVRFLNRERARTQKAIRGLSDAATRQLMAYPWPGNVRELRSAMECAAIYCTGAQIGVEDLPPEIAEQPAAGSTPAPSEGGPAGEVRRALATAKGNRKLAAQILGVSRATFYRRLAALGIQ